MVYDPHSPEERLGTALARAYRERLEGTETGELIKIVETHEARDAARKIEDEREFARVQAMPRWKRSLYQLGKLLDGGSGPDFNRLEYVIAKTILQERQTGA